MHTKKGKSNISSGLVFFLSISLAFIASCSKDQTKKVDLSPTSWPEGELEKFSELNLRNIFETTASGYIEGTKYVITGTSEPLAVRAGLEALKQGGTAADAAMTTSLSQITLGLGSYISFAGFMTMVYYEAESGQIYSMNAAYNTVQEENDPMTIPSPPNPVKDPFKPGTPSGRTALVPGFMAAVQAAHDRFGKLPFEQLFEPAIYFAEEGFEVRQRLREMIEKRKDVLSRLPETKKVFTKPDGEFYKAGDWIKQPELAKTLRHIASDGAKYMYTGEWGKRLIEGLQRDAGKMTLKDLADYEVLWLEPVHTTFRGYEIYAQGLPAHGGVDIVEGLNMVETADLKRFGHYSKSPEALFWMTQIQKVPIVSYFSTAYLKQLAPGIDLSLEMRTQKETSQKIWEQMKAGTWPLSSTPKTNAPKHSAAVVTVDQWGERGRSLSHDKCAVVGSYMYFCRWRLHTGFGILPTGNDSARRCG
jgi:gamma-glutamyltranspeptidase/glutathione hydrolase